MATLDTAGANWLEDKASDLSQPPRLEQMAQEWQAEIYGCSSSRERAPTLNTEKSEMCSLWAGVRAGHASLCGLVWEQCVLSASCSLCPI